MPQVVWLGPPGRPEAGAVHPASAAFAVVGRPAATSQGAARRTELRAANRAEGADGELRKGEKCGRVPSRV